MKTWAATLLMIVTIPFGAARLGAQESLPLRVGNPSLHDVLAALPSLKYSQGGFSSLKRAPRVDATDRKLTVVAAGLYGAMLIDTKSTFESRAWCPRCVEGNPFVAPFVEAGPATTYSAGLAFDTGVIYLAAKMRNASNPAVRRIWFVLPVALTAGHVIAARHNYGLRRVCSTSPDCR